MTSDRLPRDACRTASEQVARQAGYLTRLRDRLLAKGLPPEDRLMTDVTRAQQAVCDLRMTLHYLAVGREKGGG